jgi:beta-lactamase regulating signal transducer with metallopeptidase domain
MNSIDTVFEWLLAATLRASALTVVILGIRFVLRRWLPATWRHALWLPMLAVLVLPVLPEAPFALVSRTTPQPAPVVVEMAAEMTASSVMQVPIESAASVMPLAAAPEPASAPNAAVRVNHFAIAWLVGMCGVLAAGVIGYRRNMLRIRRSATTPDRILDAAICEAARQAGLTRVPRTLISPTVASPAVTGFLRPVLLLPGGFSEKFSAAEARLILLHEFSHLKRLDLPLNWLMCVLQAVHWFNPLLWFAFSRMRADREAACDARVLSIDAMDRRAEYGGALLKLQCVTPSRALSLGFVGIFERGSEIKSRIREISAHRPGRAARRFAGAAIVTLLMVFGLTKGQESPVPLNDENVPLETPAETPADNGIRLQHLRKAIQDQEDKVEERRKVLATIVRSKEKTTLQTLQTYHQLEQQTIQLESQINSLLKYDNDQLLVYVAGLDLPDNIVKTLYPKYLEAKRNLESLKLSGLGEGHPTMLAAVKDVDTLKAQLGEGVVQVRAMLQAQLELAKDRLKHAELEKNARKDAIRRALDAQDYIDAKKDFETDQALLVQMRDKLIDEIIAENQPRNAAPAKGGGKAAIQHKLDTIFIPMLVFEDTTIEEAIDFLRLRARELDAAEPDPNKKGLNFVIRRPRGDESPRIDELNLRNVPLGAALKYICDATQLQYAVDETAVVLSPENEVGREPAVPDSGK